MSLSYEASYEGQLRKVVGSRKLILPGVRAVIRDDQGRVLLIRRRDNGQWGFPAGGMELEESPYDTLLREVREETGLTVGSATLTAVWSGTGTNMFGNTAHRIGFVFLIDDWSGTLMTETDETADARFFHPDEVPPLPAIYAETLRDLSTFNGSVVLKEHRTY